MFKQSLQQKLRQKMSPQQIQVIKLLEVPLVELEQRVKEELESNPVLEEDNSSSSDNVEESYLRNEDIPSYKLYTNNYSVDDEVSNIPFSFELSFHEFLNNQLDFANLTDVEVKIGHLIIGNIDPDGYLRRNVKSIVSDFEFAHNVKCEENEVEKVLKIIQSFDPAGVGAQTLRECLLFQLERKFASEEIELAIEVVDLYFDLFVKKHYSKIIKQLECDQKSFKNALNIILKLNPKPGGSISSDSKVISTVTPDFILDYSETGDIQLTLNQKNIPELKISSSYTEMLEEYNKKAALTKSEREANSYIKQRLDSASWFIDAIRQRQRTLLLTMSAILDFQQEYFLDGDETKLRPMILKDIASITGFDISTISRVSNSKYIYTPFGMYSLKYFFSEAMQTDSGDDVSSREIKFILTECLENENKQEPLTDEKLTEILRSKGYQIARRTTAKYREQLNIPVARLRKEL